MPNAQESLFPVPEGWWHRKRCQVCGCALSLNFTHTYIVQRQWWVKIGATNKPRRRVNELARPAWAKHIISPPGMDWTEQLNVLLIVEDNIEHELHERFQKQHVSGEWFILNRWIREYIEEVKAQ